jgi:hypothetical protein
MSDQPSTTDHAGPNVPPDPGHDLPEPKNPDVSHEHSDVRVSSIIWAGVILAVGIGICSLGALRLFDYLSKREEQINNANPLPLAAEKGRQPLEKRIGSVPEPRLEAIQANLPGGLPPARTAEEMPQATDLTTYRKGDEKLPGTVRIPIDVAMKVLLEKKMLPVDPNSKVASEPRLGNQRPTTSNSGRGVVPEKP